MPEDVKKIRVFVASPGDVPGERDQLAKVVGEINLTVAAIAPEHPVVLELIKWETNAAPGLGRDAQAVVAQWIQDYDIFVGIMWKRFGTPTSVAGSGTEQEFQGALASWEANKTLPVLFYFCQAPFAPPKTVDDIAQLGKVVAFREELSARGLVWEYAGPETFADVIRPHLILVLSRMLSASDSAQGAAEEAGRLTPVTDVSLVRAQIVAIADEYEQLRRTLPSGDERTRKMTVCASKMRAYALPAYPLLQDLILSERAGERLAAVSILREIPTAKYLRWLADRVGVEKPFIGYQATAALLRAARELKGADRENVRMSIDAAQRTLSSLSWSDPNQVQTLLLASAEADSDG